jgi:hypothetical protein
MKDMGKVMKANGRRGWRARRRMDPEYVKW